MVTKHKETDLFTPIKNYFLNRDCEVFSEVLAGQSGSRADVVVRQKPYITVIEMKVSLSMEVLEQAYRWLRYAHFVYVATPINKKHDINDYARHCMLRDGIGLLQVDFRDRYYVKEPVVYEKIKPHFRRKIIDKWDKWLTEEHKNTLPGGSSGGGYITPYKQTIDRVKRYMRHRRYGVTLDEIVNNVPTHYCHPKPGLFNALTKFENEWCETFIYEGVRYFKIKDGVNLDVK